MKKKILFFAFINIIFVCLLLLVILASNHLHEVPGKLGYYDGRDDQWLKG
jgi:hypothetical protein